MTNLDKCVRHSGKVKSFIDESTNVHHYEFGDHRLEDRFHDLIMQAAHELDDIAQLDTNIAQELRVIAALQLYADRRTNQYSWWSKMSILPGVRSWLAGLIKVFVG